MSFKILGRYSFSREAGYINGIVSESNFSRIFDFTDSQSSHKFENDNENKKENAVSHISPNQQSSVHFCFFNNVLGAFINLSISNADLVCRSNKV